MKNNLLNQNCLNYGIIRSSMLQLVSLSKNPIQSSTCLLENGNSFILDLNFCEMQSCWYFSINDLTTGKIINGLRLVVSPNLLCQYNVNFALSCVSSDGYEPAFIDDFISGRISLYTAVGDEFKLIQDVYA